jgi:hypothetical protein
MKRGVGIMLSCGDTHKPGLPFEACKANKLHFSQVHREFVRGGESRAGDDTKRG